MAIETPARIAIVGAGPCGLEAALYARYLGYDVDVYERGRITEHLRQWGHVPLFAPAGANRSPLGLAALAAQDSAWRPPNPDAHLTAEELAQRYYLPLAKTDLLADSIHEQTEVSAISRGEFLKGEFSDSEREDADFRLLLRSTDAAAAAPSERLAAADVVIDASGVFGQHNWLGAGGIPAIGETAAQGHIEYGLPDIMGRDRAIYAHRHTLLIGSGHSAAASADALARLGHEAPYTQITWVVRRSVDPADGPIRRIPHDPWPARDRLAQTANQLIQGEVGHLTFCPGTNVERVAWQGEAEKFQVHLAGQHAGELEIDRIIANVGHRPDSRLYAELQVAADPVRGAAPRWPPLPPSAACLSAGLPPVGMELPDPQTLVTGEPDFYILGAKSVGRGAHFTIAEGLLQIRQIFTILGDRPGLNLYGSPPRPTPPRS